MTDPSIIRSIVDNRASLPLILPAVVIAGTLLRSFKYGGGGTDARRLKSKSVEAIGDGFLLVPEWSSNKNYSMA